MTGEEAVIREAFRKIGPHRAVSTCGAGEVRRLSGTAVSGDRKLLKPASVLPGITVTLRITVGGVNLKRNTAEQ